MPTNPRIAVQISAQDQFTATLSRLRKDIQSVANEAGRASKRIDDVATPKTHGFDVGGLTRRAARYHSELRERIGTSFRSGIPGVGLFGSVSGSIPGMGAIAGAAGAAGISEMVGRYATAGVALENTARLAGTSAEGLNSFRGAARMMGLDVATADAAMGGLNHTLADAAFGRNATAARTFQQLGISFGSMRTGAQSAESALPGVVSALSALAKTSPLAAEHAAEIFGIPAAALPMFIRGNEALQNYRQEVEKIYGSMSAYEAASGRYSEATGRMGIVTDRLGQTIMTSLEPHLTPMLNHLADWVGTHDKDIAETFDRIGHALENIPWKEVGKGVDDLGHFLAEAATKLDELTNSLGRYYKQAQDAKQLLLGKTSSSDADASAAYWTLDPNRGATPRERLGFGGAVGAIPAQTVPLAPGERTANARAMADVFQREGGLTREAASALLGGGIQESGLNPRSGAGTAHQGIFQLSDIRRAAVEAHYQKRLMDMTPVEQARAALWEIDTKPEFAGLGRQFRSSHDLAANNDAATRTFEVPGNYGTEVPRRLGLSQGVDAELRKTPNGTPPIGPAFGPQRPGLREEPAPEQPDPSRGGRLPALLATPAVADNGNSTVRLEINHNNPPPGVTARATSDSDNIDIAGIRTRRAMPDAGFAPAFGGT